MFWKRKKKMSLSDALWVAFREGKTIEWKIGGIRCISFKPLPQITGHSIEHMHSETLERMKNEPQNGWEVAL